MAHDVFISYSTKDTPAADAVCHSLEANGVRCWIAPRNIQPGAEWSEAIMDGLSRSRAMVLIFSSGANDSIHVKREVERALHKRLPIVPLRIEDVLPTEAMEYFLSTIHWLDAVMPPLEEHLPDLTRRVSELLSPAHREEEKRPSTSASRLPGLPAPTLPLIGRAAELEAWCLALREPTTRLLTLTGTGGMGKSRAALELARLFADRFKEECPDGVRWVELPEIRTGDEMVQRIAYSLNFGFQPPPSAREQLFTFLRGRRMLLVLDNMEQIGDASAKVIELLQAAPSLKLLATSRRALGLVAEQVKEVEPLPESDAERLFERIAAARRPGFALNESNIAVVAEICRRLEGVPLAIVLAASRIGMGPQQVLKRLADRCLDLEASAPDLPPRQRALRAMIDWSYALLTEETKWLFAQLAVFAGGFTYDDVEAVCEAGDAWEGLEDLIQHSMVRTRFDVTVQQERLFMLESLREYAAEKLPAFGDAGVQTRQRHAERFLCLAVQRIDRVRKPDEVPALNQLEADIDNVRSAMNWYHERKLYEPYGQLALAFGRFLRRRGSFREALSNLEMGLAAGESVSEGQSRVRAELLLERAGLHVSQFEWAAARGRATEALGIFEVFSDGKGQADAYNLLGMAARGAKEYDEARCCLDRALTEFRRIQDEPGASRVLNNLGRVEEEAGRKEEAARHLQAALAARRKEGDKRGIAETLTNLGLLAHNQGRLEEARQYYDEALLLETELQYTFGVARALHNLGDVAELKGEHENAYRLASAAESLFERVGSPYKQESSELLQKCSGRLGRAGDTPATNLQDRKLEDLVAWALESPAP